MATNLLADIELNDKQIKAFNEELNNWKQKTRDQLAEEVRTEIQTEYDVKIREIDESKETFKQEQVELVEEIKTKMQKVMVKRFTSALKEMYDELKVEARKDVLNDPRILALESIKSVVFPLMDETVTKGYVDELQKALQMIESKEDENDKLKARLKLKEITSTLSPVVAEAVEAFVGEATTEEDVVEKYSKLKNLVKEANDDEDDDMEDVDDEDEEDEEDEDGKKKKKKSKKKSKKSDDDDDEDDDEMDYDIDEANDDDDEDMDDMDYDDDDEGDKKKKKKKKKKSDDDDEDEDDEDEGDEDDEDMEEGLEINPMVHFDKKEKESTDYAGQLNELLELAGIEK